MNIYREGSGTYQIKIYDFDKNRTANTSENAPKGKVQVTFKRKGLYHRTDGPAVVTWDVRRKGVTSLYYLNGVHVDKDKYLKVLNAPMEDMPIYLNDPLFKDLAIDRLKGTRSSIELSVNRDMTSIVKSKTLLLSLKQLKVLELTRTIQRMVRVNIQNLQPFKRS